MVTTSSCTTIVSCITSIITLSSSARVTSTLVTSASRSTGIISSNSSVPIVTSSRFSNITTVPPPTSTPVPPFPAGLNDIACIGNMVPACCDGSSIDGSEVITGCERYNVSDPVCAVRGQVYCCDSLNPAVPCIDGDCGLFGFDCQDYYGDNCDPADAGCGNQRKYHHPAKPTSSSTSTVTVTSTVKA